MTDAAVRRRLLAWYRRDHRRLPWRQSRDPYAIWVSETMLQQTRTATVLRYYQRFLARFPDAAALARARESSVLAVWSGLGYYSRARNLHRAARAVVDRHGGRMPADPAALRALPGVGRYTAGAVASIAFGIRAPVVDGNVARVLARVFAVPGRMRSPRFERRVWDLAARLVPSGAPGEWNQALMELGATLCTPRDPSCGRCPVRRRCAAHATATTHRLPAPATRRPITTARRAVAVVESGERLLLVRRSGPLLRGLWEFPGVEVGGSRPAAPLVQRELDRLGLPPPMLVPAGSIRHTILDRRIETEVYRGSLEDASPVRPPGRWMRRARLRSLPLSAAALKIAGDVAARQDRP